MPEGLKLFAWQPKHHGSCSFFVAAISEDEARKAVAAHIQKQHYSPDSEAERLDASEFYGWGTDRYRLTVLAPGQVAMNTNE